MLHEDERAAIVLLGPEVWRAEIAAGRYSRYNDEKRAYMEQLVDRHSAVENERRHAESLAAAAQANEIAVRANELSERANRLAEDANATAQKSERVASGSRWFSGVALVVALVAAGASIVQAWYTAHPPSSTSPEKH